jgi:hypothetical protein
MPANIEAPTKEVDVDFLVFVERYATDLLKWDILTLFGHQPDFYGSTAEIAAQIGRSSLSIRPELGDLVLLGILEQTQATDGQTVFNLTAEPQIRRITLKFANNQSSSPLSE